MLISYVLSPLPLHMRPVVDAIFRSFKYLQFTVVAGAIF